ncbi:hypothetical protein AAMO2058_000581900 [Amorphochlora amoebiformis]
MVAQLTRELEAVNEKYHEAETERKNAEFRASQSTRDLESITQRYAGAMAEVLDLRRSLEKRKEAVRQRLSLEVKQRDNEATIATLTERVRELEEDRKAIEAERGSILVELEKQNNRVHQLQAQCQYLTKKTQDAEKLADTSSKALSTTSRAEEALRAANKRLTAELETEKLEVKILVRKRARLLLDLRKGLQQSESSREKLKSDLNSLKQAYQSTRRSLNMLSESQPPSLPPPPPPGSPPGSPPSSPPRRGVLLVRRNTMPASKGQGIVEKFRSFSETERVSSRSMSPAGAMTDTKTGKACHSKPPPPHWTMEAERDYFLEMGNRLEAVEEQNYRLKQRVKFLEASVQVLQEDVRTKREALRKMAARSNARQISDPTSLVEDTLEENEVLRDALKKMAIEVKSLSDKLNKYQNGWDSGVEIQPETAAGAVNPPRYTPLTPLAGALGRIEVLTNKSKYQPEAMRKSHEEELDKAVQHALTSGSPDHSFPDPIEDMHMSTSEISISRSVNSESNPSQGLQDVEV